MRWQFAACAQKSAKPAPMSADSIKWTIAKSVQRPADSARLSAGEWQLKAEALQK